MITIGVTGGVGSGKSEILKYLENNYNCRILMSDNAAKDLEVPGGALYEPLICLLEKNRSEEAGRHPLLLDNGEIDKQEMARRIFADPRLLGEINALVHPAVNRYILEEIERERGVGQRAFFVLESALLIENGYDRILDSMWYIYCEQNVRSQRLRQSRGYSDEKIRSIMERQVSDETFREHCDIVIDNTGPFYEPGGAASMVDAAISLLLEKYKTREGARQIRNTGTGADNNYEI